MTWVNFCKIFFSTVWWYAVPYIGGFTKMNSYHMYKVFEAEAEFIEENIDSIYDKQMDAAFLGYLELQEIMTAEYE